MKFKNSGKVVGGIKYSIPIDEPTIDLETLRPAMHNPYILEDSAVSYLTNEGFYVPKYAISTEKSENNEVAGELQPEAQEEIIPISYITAPTVRYLDVSSGTDFNPDEVLENYISELKQREGLRLHAYKDGSGWSIGYGHHGAKPGDKITEEEAERLLREDISRHSDWLKSQISKYNLTANQFLALFDFGYNTGVGNLQRLMANADIDTMRGRLGTWGHRSNGQVLQSLVDRSKWRVKIFG